MPCRLCHCLLLILCGLISAQATAQSREAEHEARFRAADRDNSRGLSRQELENGMPKVLSSHFDEIDLDANGELSPEELKSMARRQAQQREQRRAERLRRMQRHK